MSAKGKLINSGLLVLQHACIKGDLNYIPGFFQSIFFLYVLIHTFLKLK